MPRLLTVLLNYKTADMTLEAAEAALREMEGLDAELTIVDNDSQDGSFEKISAAVAEKGWERVRVIQSGVNGGFGAGNNVGIRAGLSDGTKPDYVYILNSDAFPDKDAIRILLNHLEQNPEVGFAGSYIHGPDGDDHVTLFRYHTIWSELEGAAQTGPISRALKNYIVPQEIPDRTIEVDWLAGASLMMRQKVLDEIGLFDERFFLYYEETDLCRRAKLAGWPTHYVRESEVTHIGSVSTGMKVIKRMPRYWFDSRLYYFTKNHGGLYAAAATIAHVVGALIHRVRCLISRKQLDARANFLGDLIGHALGAPFRPKPKARSAAAPAPAPVNT